MSWNRTPPLIQSPRKPKIQQQSWDGTPTINLYEPNREYYDSSPNVPSASASQPMKKAPASHARKINYGKYCLPNPLHQMSDPGTYYNMTSSSSSQKSPKSPNTAFDFEMSSRSSLKSVASNRRYYEDTSASDTTSSALMSPRKFEFGAVSPKFDNTGTLSKHNDNLISFHSRRERR